MSEEENVQWGKFQKSKKSWILVRMVLAFGKSFQEAKPEMVGRWKPGSVFEVKFISDVLDVKVKLEEVLLGKIAKIIWKIEHQRDISDKMCLFLHRYAAGRHL